MGLYLFEIAPVLTAVGVRRTRAGVRRAAALPPGIPGKGGRTPARRDDACPAPTAAAAAIRAARSTPQA